MNEAQTLTAARELRIAVLHMASLVCPTGYDVVDVAPASLPALRHVIARTGRIPVWRGESVTTIYDDEEANWAARAWHDWTHYRFSFDFTLNGEISVAHQQVRDLTRVFGKSLATARWAALLFAEVIGQARFKEHSGSFPTDQRTFSLAAAPGYLDMARAAVLDVDMFGHKPDPHGEDPEILH